MEIADEIYNLTKAYIDARDQYTQAAELDPTNIRANYMAGKLFMETINKERSAKYYQQVYLLNPIFKSVFDSTSMSWGAMTLLLATFLLFFKI